MGDLGLLRVGAYPLYQVLVHTPSTFYVNPHSFFFAQSYSHRPMTVADADAPVGVCGQERNTLCVVFDGARLAHQLPKQAYRLGMLLAVRLCVAGGY